MAALPFPTGDTFFSQGLDTYDGSKVSELDPRVQSWVSAPFVNDSFIVRFSDSVTREQADATLYAEVPGSSILDWDDELSLATVQLPEGLTRQDVLDLSHDFLRLNNTLYAEPNFLRELRRTPDDPFYPTQWNMDNTGQFVFDDTFPALNGYFGSVDADIDAPEAWDITTGSPEVVVAVLDSGYNRFEADFQPNYWVNPRETYNGIDDDGNGVIDDYNGYDAAMRDGDPHDDAISEHGMQVASIVSAPGNDGIGMTGVSWNSKIMFVKIEDDTGGITTGGVIGGIQYVTKMKQSFGINIVAANMSFGGPQFSFSEFDALRVLGTKDVLIVAAAANQGYNHDILFDAPTGYNVDQIIAVTASNAIDEMAVPTAGVPYIPGSLPEFGYGGFNVDIAAPGIHVMVMGFRYPVAPGFFTNLSVTTGTSFAAPHVAGVAALMESIAPYLTALEIKNLIISSADKIPYLNNLNLADGRLNAFNALNAIPKTTITGTVFQDANNDRVQGIGEVGLGDWQVYLDLNNNGIFDPGEPGALTIVNAGTTGPLTGTYSFDAWLDTGTYRVRQVVQTDYLQTTPTANNGSFVLNVTTRGQDFANLNFGNRMQPGTIVGRKFLDLNANGTFDDGEPGQAGILFYVDMNNNGRINVGEPAAYTDSQGNFTIPNIQPGTYPVREVITPGYIPTLPNTVGANGLPDPILNVTVVSNISNTPPLLFGNRVARDWGDLPEFIGGAPAFQTRSVNGGPSHGILPGFMLGQRIDLEADGQPSATALGDDLNPTGALSDEDGLISINLVQGSQGEIVFRVTNIGQSIGLVQGWVDFNGDGSFGSGEQILRNFTPINGLNTVPFTVPGGVAPGVTYARLRYAYERDLGPNGPAFAGEVEDYQITIFSALPTARDDRFPEQLFPPPNDPAFTNDPLIKQESVNNLLDVLRNDPPPATGTLTIVPGSFPGMTQNGGTLVLSTVSGMQVLLYTPRGGINPFTGIDSFTYRVTNGTDESLPATVQVRVTASDPRAVDNTYTFVGNVPSNPNPQPVSYTMDVLSNDIFTPSAPITLLNFSQPTYLGFTLTGPSVTQSGNNLVITPPSGFVGTVQFQYTIADTDPTTVDATAIVTVQFTNVPALPPAPQYLAMLSVEVWDARNNILGISPAFRVDVGEVFYVHVFSQDLRPGGDATNRGVEAAYLDLLYDYRLAAVNFIETSPGSGTFVPDVTFDPGYDFDRNRAGFNAPEGVYQELGAAHNSLDDVPPGFPLGTGRKPVLIVGLAATAAGSLKIIPDPAEDSMERSQIGLAPEPSDPNYPSPVPAPDTLVFLAESPIFQISVPGAPEFINSTSTLDVNADGKITAFDALAVVNELNMHGSRKLRNYDMAIGGGLPPAYYVDTNGDGSISAFDALGIINHLNQHPTTSAGESGSGGEATGGGGSAGESVGGGVQSSGLSGGEAIEEDDGSASGSSSSNGGGLVFYSLGSSTQEKGSPARNADIELGGLSRLDSPELLYLTAVDELMSQTGDDHDGEISSTGAQPPSNWLNFSNRLRASLRTKLSARGQ